ncbi:gallidermin/nisin family lantibiotic [Paenibacillus sp. 28ISP30-2]|nr:gallidermin/nisin family lantibiotic [Paenibacillus sp. 23TSA30-6]MBE0336514.1 gallidermin/nisin family lantibiotic [Paenibacillus sp. 23TSA30-6]MBE0344224.1 gallidermin/nisin family lantibiotic [Paenibacillus sp. 28ISP30-2]
MKKFDDFDLDIISVSKEVTHFEPQITSISLCTIGCNTSFLKCLN